MSRARARARAGVTGDIMFHRNSLGISRRQACARERRELRRRVQERLIFVPTWRARTNEPDPERFAYAIGAIAIFASSFLLAFLQLFYLRRV